MMSEAALSKSVITQRPSSVSKELPFPPSPYRGIEHYRFADHRIFFARQAETLELMRSVMMYKGTLVFGGSGVGKSSLIDAGLLPRLIEMDFAPERIRVQNRKDAEIVIERISLNACGNPPYLSPSLADEIANDERPRIVLSLDEFGKHLRAYAENHYPLLVLDQFEEIITLFEETPHEPGSHDDILERQERLIDFFVEILHDYTLRVKILFSFREDYLAKLTKLFKRAPELPNQYMRLNSPQKKALPDIIARPLRPELQVHYARQQAFSADLISKLETELKQRADGDAINLSEVQIVCLQLWESEDPDQLFAKGGVQGLLEDYFTAELNQFSDEQRGMAVGLLSHMLTASNTRNFVSGVELIRMFQNEEQVSEETLKKVLIELTGTRLVRRELRHKDYFYEIASEFLVPKIIEKKTKRQTRLERKRLEAESEEERRRAEQKLVQKNRLLALMILVVVLALVLASEMIRRKKQEQDLRLVAETAKNEKVQEATEKEQIISILRHLFTNQPDPPRLKQSELTRRKINLSRDKIAGLNLIASSIKSGEFPVDDVPALVGNLTQDRDPAVASVAHTVLAEVNAIKDSREKIAQNKLQAIQQMRELMQKQKFPSELVLSLLGPALIDKNSNPAIAKAAEDLLEEAREKNSQVEALVTAAAINDPSIADRLPARVYVQIESPQLSNRANAIKDALEKSGYVVPGFEIVGTVRAPASPELRYYRREDAVKVDEIINILKKLDLEVKPKYLSGYEDSGRIRPGHYELWLAGETPRGEKSYLVISAPVAEEQRLSLLYNVSTVTEREGGRVETLSRNELLLGPYDDDQVRTVRQRLIDQDPGLTRRGKLTIIKR